MKYETHWVHVKPFTPVFVRDSEDDDWTRVYFLGYDSDAIYKYQATYSGQWTDDGIFESWKYCRIATQKEIDEVIVEVK